MKQILALFLVIMVGASIAYGIFSERATSALLVDEPYVNIMMNDISYNTCATFDENMKNNFIASCMMVDGNAPRCNELFVAYSCPPTKVVDK